MTTTAPTTMDVLQYYMDIGDTTTPEYANVTEDTAFDPSVEFGSYTTAYKDRKVQPTISTGKKITIDVDIDIIKGQDLQDWLITHEDDVNVPTKVVRVWTDGTTATALEAKQADFLWNPQQLDGPAGSPIKGKGTLTMVSDGWVKGTWDSTTKAFTATAG